MQTQFKLSSKKTLLIFDLDETLIRSNDAVKEWSKTSLSQVPLEHLLFDLEKIKKILKNASIGNCVVGIITWNLDLTPDDPEYMGGRRATRVILDRIHGSDTTPFIPDVAIISERPDGFTREALGKNVPLRKLMQYYSEGGIAPNTWFYDDNYRNIVCSLELKEEFPNFHPFWTPEGYGETLPKIDLKTYEKMKKKPFARMMATSKIDSPTFEFSVASSSSISEYMSLILNSSGKKYVQVDLNAIQKRGRWMDFLRFTDYLKRKIPSFQICVPSSKEKA